MNNICFCFPLPLPFFPAPLLPPPVSTISSLGPFSCPFPSPSPSLSPSPPPLEFPSVVLIADPVPHFDAGALSVDPSIFLNDTLPFTCTFSRLFVEVGKPGNAVEDNFGGGALDLDVRDDEDDVETENGRMAGAGVGAGLDAADDDEELLLLLLAQGVLRPTADLTPPPPPPPAPRGGNLSAAFAEAFAFALTAANDPGGGGRVGPFELNPTFAACATRSHTILDEPAPARKAWLVA